MKAKGSKKANGYFEKAKKADTDTDTETDTDTDTDIDTETDTDIKQVVVIIIAAVEERARGNLPVDNLSAGLQKSTCKTSVRVLYFHTTHQTHCFNTRDGQRKISEAGRDFLCPCGN